MSRIVCTAGTMILAIVCWGCMGLAVDSHAADQWTYAVLATPERYGSCSTNCSFQGVLVAHCYQKDDTRPDYIGVAVRLLAGALDEDWRSWIQPEGVNEQDKLAIDLLASLRPIAVWGQLFQIADYACACNIEDRDDCKLSYPASGFSQTVASRYYDSVGLQTRGWIVNGWNTRDSVLEHEFLNGILFLFVPGTQVLSISYSARIWDDGLHSWNDGGSEIEALVTVECSRNGP